MKLPTSSKSLRRLMNLYPPLLFSGIRIHSWSEDGSRIEVRLRLRPWNRNYVGTAFGGSLFAMTDPFWMIMLMRHLARDHVVWDRAGEIDFVSPGRTDVRAVFVLEQERVEAIRKAAADGARHLEWFEVDVTTPDGTVVARVRKQIYVRRKQRA